MKRNLIAGAVIALLFASCAFVNYVPLSDIPLITKEQLVKLIDNPQVTILDVRVDQDWTDSRQKIKGAVREEPRDFLAWAPKYPKDRQIVLYCEWMDEATSAGLARILITEYGFTNTQALKGGWKEWLHAGYPVEPK